MALGNRYALELEFDFKGNLLSNEKQFATNYKTTINWSSLTGQANVGAIDTVASSSLATGTITSSIEYDALDRSNSRSTVSSAGYALYLLSNY